MAPSAPSPGGEPCGDSFPPGLGGRLPGRQGEPVPVRMGAAGRGEPGGLAKPVALPPAGETAAAVEPRTPSGDVALLMAAGAP